MHQWMGNLFYRGAAPASISAMDFHELRYWNQWHAMLSHRPEGSDA